MITDDGLAQAALFGLFRTVAMEVPEVFVRLVDVDNKELSEPSALLDVLNSDNRETELVIRDGRVHAARLKELAEQELTPAMSPVSRLGQARNFGLRHSGVPGADGLRWKQASQASLGPDDVTIEVRAAGLNFRDVMAVSGVLPADAEPTPAIEALGLELSGVVIDRGDNVDTFEVGDHVVGMGRGTLQRRVSWPSSAVKLAPPGLSHAEAASIPSAYLTAHYALNKVARLQPGMSVLIHSATGGVGLAAITLARLAGARVLATAGSPEKRDYLRRLDIGDVFDSRSLGFADDVMRATGGRGVDVVLNSLGGAFIDKSLACIAPYGQFLELGKRDVYADGTLGLRNLRSNVSFHVIDLAALIGERPQLASEMLDEVLAMLASQKIDALPIAEFGASTAGEAFRLMSEAKHIGKVILGLDDPDLRIESALSDGASLDPDGTYLGDGRCRWIWACGW